ncbi:LytR/AlgR family response regulator transcription factor [Pedobacter fastidiosus]|uniref:Response regulator transcription factor n=1 Tax=Pedobacter fastidiosus TaxID=2765361 RepID=A0ABR7KYK0_9SPHI|nr:LytTR family DNA-binding domain-containing protein [Pedobacter fastidiosus]MBC6113205.1 response regulator transcription factor [Pedobacter fastidiosus]
MNLPIFNCLIVDDEPPAREVLKRYIAKMPILHLVGECGNALQVIPFLHQHPVDIIFLDIRMPQLTGLELVSTLTRAPKIIFTTVFAEHALESYELDAVDYLLKPIKFERFVKAINKAITTGVLPAINQSVEKIIRPQAAGRDNFLYFRSDRKMVKVYLRDIRYIESLKDYVKIVTAQGQVITKYSMVALEAMLPSSNFVRIHRSYIIAIDQLRSYTTNHIQLGTTELPIGKLYQREVFDTLKKRNDSR